MFKEVVKLIWNPWGAAATAAVAIVGFRCLRAVTKSAVAASLAVCQEARSIVDEARQELNEAKAAHK